MDSAPPAFVAVTALLYPLDVLAELLLRSRVRAAQVACPKFLPGLRRFRCGFHSSCVDGDSSARGIESSELCCAE